MSAEGFHVLLVEDNEADVYLLRKALEDTGLTIDLMVIGDGAEALAFARSAGRYREAPAPDLAVLDLNLPKYDGVEVLTALRRSERFAALPVVILTSSSSPEDRRRTESLGVARYLIKPTDLDAFLQIGVLLVETLRSRTRGAAG